MESPRHKVLTNGLYASRALVDELNGCQEPWILFSSKLELILGMKGMKRPRLNIFAVDERFAWGINVVSRLMPELKLRKHPWARLVP